MLKTICGKWIEEESEPPEAPEHHFALLYSGHICGGLPLGTILNIYLRQ
jgi:hypothetical protein